MASIVLVLLLSTSMLAQGVVGAKGVIGPKGVIGSPVGGLTFTEVQSKLGSFVTSGTTATVTMTSAPTAGNAVICGLAFFTGALTVTSIKDNAGTPNTYTPSPSSPSDPSGGPASWELAYLINVPAGAGSTITATLGNTITYNTSIRCTEFHRSSGSWTYDTNGASVLTTAATTVTQPTLTVAGAGELLYGVAATSSSAQITPINSPWTADPSGSDTNTESNAGYILSSASGGTALNFTISSSANYTAMGIALK